MGVSVFEGLRGTPDETATSAALGVRVEGLRASQGGEEILHGVDLAADSGKLVGLIGPNGSGKSTLLKCIYRVLKPTAGAVWLGERELSGYSVRESAQRVAVLAQHNAYSFEFTVLDVVLMGRSPHKGPLSPDDEGDYAIAREALAAVGMASFERRLFSTLSGGEQQRVVLARALAQRTGCLILDEPTNHLDVKYQLELMDVVSGLGKTVICAVHDLNVAAMYCQRLYALKAGRIVASGTPEEVVTPEVIRDVYGVEVRIYVDEDGVRHVLYRPGHVRR